MIEETMAETLEKLERMVRYKTDSEFTVADVRHHMRELTFPETRARLDKLVEAGMLVRFDNLYKIRSPARELVRKAWV